MKKKSLKAKSLTLNRETLKSLEEGQQAVVAGGITKGYALTGNPCQYLDCAY